MTEVADSVSGPMRAEKLLGAPPTLCGSKSGAYIIAVLTLPSCMLGTRWKLAVPGSGVGDSMSGGTKRVSADVLSKFSNGKGGDEVTPGAVAALNFAT